MQQQIILAKKTKNLKGGDDAPRGGSTRAVACAGEAAAGGRLSLPRVGKKGGCE